MLGVHEPNRQDERVVPRVGGVKVRCIGLVIRRTSNGDDVALLYLLISEVPIDGRLLVTCLQCSIKQYLLLLLLLRSLRLLL
jgi:hypothetical protein